MQHGLQPDPSCTNHASPDAPESALTLPHWRTLMAPVVADLAQAFRAALTEGTGTRAHRMHQGLSRAKRT